MYKHILREGMELLNADIVKWYTTSWLKDKWQNYVMLAPEGILEVSDPFYRQEHWDTDKFKIVKSIQSKLHRWPLG